MQKFNLFDSLKGNRVALSQLLSGENISIVEVIDVHGPGNNSIATIELLEDGVDEDNLPIIVHTGKFKRYRYDRENIDNVIKQHVPLIDGVPTITLSEVSVFSVTEALLSYDLNLGDDAIEVAQIADTDKLIIKCNTRSIRFRGETRIRFQS